MAVNKVMDSVGNILIDLTGDTITADKVLQGYTFHDRSGSSQVGSLATVPTGCVANYSEDNVVRFIDYDGEIIAEYSIAEANALQALPTPPAHERIIFEKWNHTLEEVQTTTHSLCVGALYITVDDAAYIKFFVTQETINISHAIRFYRLSTGTFNIDWGDGTNEDVDVVSTGTGYSASPAHYYSSIGTYIIKITKGTADIRIYSYGGSSESNCYCIFSNYQLTKKVLEINIPSWQSIVNNYQNRLGTMGFQYARNLTAISIPSTFIGFTLDYTFGNTNLKCVIYPTETCVLAGNAQYDVKQALYVSIPRKVYGVGWQKNIGMFIYLISNAYKNIIFPEKYYFDNGTTVTEYETIDWQSGSTTIFSSQYLEYIYLGNLFNSKRIGFFSGVNSGTDYSKKRLKKIEGNYGFFADSNFSNPIITYDMYLDVENFTINPNYSDTIPTLSINLLNIGKNQKSIILKPSVTALSLNIQAKQLPLDYLDMSLFEAPPTLSAVTLTYITFKIKVMRGTLSLYQAATNWSTLYAAGLIEEATE